VSADAPQYYWDSCVFIVFLKNERDAYGQHIDHIAQFLDEAKAGHCRIYCSTITLAEITPDKLIDASVGTFGEFLADFKSVVIPVSPDVNMMTTAGHLRSMTYTKTNGARRLLTPDAIHLATALGLESAYQVKVDTFHTFDGGRNSNAVPLIGYEMWCEACADDEVVKRVIALKREAPTHPEPKFAE
jgi:predicted nucleic acid-binding protein